MEICHINSYTILSKISFDAQICSKNRIEAPNLKKKIGHAKNEDQSERQCKDVYNNALDKNLLLYLKCGTLDF